MTPAPRPVFVDRHTAAAWCSVSVETWDAWVKAGFAPPPSIERNQTIRYRFRAACAALGLSGLKVHGLRAMAVCDARIAGQPHQQIAAAIGMSLPMVMHYSRHIDQRMAAMGGRRKG